MEQKKFIKLRHSFYNVNKPQEDSFKAIPIQLLSALFPFN